jgi:hypothetical protein
VMNVREVFVIGTRIGRPLWFHTLH